MKIKYIPQNEAAECGLACLAMIFSGFGFTTDLGYLRKKYPISSRGMTALDLVNVAQSTGFNYKVSRYSLEQLASIDKPVIIHWKNDHFIVFERMCKRGYRVFDPATGAVLLDKREMSKGFTGIVISLEPNENFVKGNYVKKIRLSDIYQTVREYKELALTLILSSFFIELVAIAIPLAQQAIIDNSYSNANTPLLFAFVIATILTVRAFCVFAHSLITRRILYKATSEMTPKLFAHLLDLPVSYYVNRFAVDIFYRTKSVFYITQVMAMGLTDIVLGLALSLVVVVVLFNYSVTLTALVLIGPLLNLLTRKYLNGPLIDLLKSSLYIFSRSQSTLMESIKGIQSIKSSSKEAQRIHKYTAQVSKYVRREHEYMTLQSKVVFLSNIYDGLGYLLVTAVGGYYVTNNILTVGQFVAYFGLSTHFFFNINRFIDRLFDIQMLSAHWDRILDIVHEETEHKLYGKTLSNSSTKIDNIKLENISFRWGMNQPDILSNISLNISKNDKFVIIGESGVGKSTLIKILSGQLYPSDGNIFINDVNCYSKNGLSYRNRISVLNQDDRLFSGTVLENITMFDASPNLNDVHHSASIAGLVTESGMVKHGYEYYIDADSNHISGGDKQRILIARAIYQKPELLIMDESTTFVGEESERKLFKRLIALPFSVVVVTHRRNFLELFDSVYSMSYASDMTSENQLSDFVDDASNKQWRIVDDL